MLNYQHLELEVENTLNIMESNMLKKGGLFIFEHGKDYDFSEHPQFVRHIAYGSVNFSFFKKQ